MNFIFQMSSSSSLEDILPPWDVCFGATTAVQRRAWAQFWKSSQRIQVGRNKLNCPISFAHMMMNCLFWRVATEQGDQPTHILTETHIDPTDPKFWRAWFAANGLFTLEPHDFVDNVFVDYLLFERARNYTDDDNNNIELIQTAKRKIEAQLHILAQQEKERQQNHQARMQDEYEDEALEWMNRYSQEVQKAVDTKKPFSDMPIGNKPRAGVCRLLRVQGFKVFYKDPWWFLGRMSPKELAGKHKPRAKK